MSSKDGWTPETPDQDPMWWQALAHLEEQWPERLEYLLRNGALKNYLDKLTNRANQAAFKARERTPSLSLQDALEGATRDVLMPENPKYDASDPKELSQEGKRFLQKFKDRILESDQPTTSSSPTTLSSQAAT